MLLLEVTDGHALGTARNSELLPVGAPLYIKGSPVNPENDQTGLPDILSLVVRPHECVPIVAAGDDEVGHGTPVDGGDQEIMFAQGVEFSPFLHIRVGAVA